MCIHLYIVKMDNKKRLDILKIDLDHIKSKKKVIDTLKERLDFLDKWNFFNLDKIICIEYIKKTNCGVIIYLNNPITIDMLIILQLILGSDYKKEVFTLNNYFRKKDYYFNRLFTIKRYVDGNYKKSKIIDITKDILTDLIKLKIIRKQNYDNKLKSYTKK